MNIFLIERKDNLKKKKKPDTLTNKRNLQVLLICYNTVAFK